MQIMDVMTRGATPNVSHDHAIGGQHRMAGFDIGAEVPGD